LESEIELIFEKITGIKNFNNADRIKAQFDQNKGIILGWDKASMIIDQTNRVKSNTANVPHRMDFCLFVKSFELIGKKLHPERNLDQAFVIFIEKDIRKLLTENEHGPVFTEKRKINDLLFNLRKGESVEVLRDIHPLIFPHYENYSNQKGLMNFETFFNFYKEYAIFPEMINLIFLKNIYFVLTDIYSRQLNNPGGQINYSKSMFESITKQAVTGADNPHQNRRAVNKNEYINYDLFLDSLALTANQMKNSDNTYKAADKILYLLEKVSHSEGAKKCLLKSGKTFYTSKEYIDHAYSLRMKYRGFYGKKEVQKKKIKKKKFEKIFY